VHLRLLHLAVRAEAEAVKVERFPSKHPLCTCPDLTFANFAHLDRSQCAGGATAHPVLTADDMRHIADTFKERP
jgi:hypothetical protein